MALRTSYAQFVIMVEFMEKNGDLSKPTGGPRGRQYCNQNWRVLTEKLNSEGAGEFRTEERWRKVWSDLKNNTKKKWAKLNKAVKGTGGGPALKITLTDLENRVMAIMGIQAAAGMPVPEIGFGGQTEEALIENNWNTPFTSTDPIPHTSQLLFTPPRPCSPTPKSPTPPATTPPPSFANSNPSPLTAKKEKNRRIVFTM